MEQGPADVLAKLKRKELTLFKAAEILNVTVTTLANYLATLKQLKHNDNVVSLTESSAFRVDVAYESDGDDDSEEDSKLANQNVNDITT